MRPTLSAQEFLAKWRKATLKERSAAPEHFIDLCRLAGHPMPAEADPSGQSFTFEAGASKQRGGQGWADVWKSRWCSWQLIQGFRRAAQPVRPAPRLAGPGASHARRGGAGCIRLAARSER